MLWLITVSLAITSFVGSFVLIRYKLVDADAHLPTDTAPHDPSPISPSGASSSKGRASDDKTTIRPGVFDHYHGMPTTPADFAPSDSHGSEHTSFSPNLAFNPLQAARVLNLFSMWQSWSDTLSDVQGRVFIHQLRPLGCFTVAGRNTPRNGCHVDPPVRLLSHCHSLSVAMAIMGFVLALLGILAYAWTSLPVSIAAFASACLGGCGFAVFVTMMFS